MTIWGDAIIRETIPLLESSDRRTSFVALHESAAVHFSHVASGGGMSVTGGS